MKTARIIGILLLGLIMGLALMLKFTVLKNEDTSTLKLIGEEYLARALSDDVVKYQQEKIKAKTARERTAAIEETYEQAKIESALQFIPWKVSFQKTTYIMLLCVGCVGFLGLMGFLGLGKLRQNSIVTQRIGEHSTLQVHYDLVKRPEMGALLAGLVNVEQAKAINPEKALEYGERLLTHFEAITRRQSLSGQMLAALPSAGPMAPAAETPTFIELLHEGRIAPGKPLIFGYNQQGEVKTGTWVDLFSSGIGGQSGSGKSATLRSLISQSLVSGEVSQFWVLDDHYPHPKSLLASLGVLKDLPQVVWSENEFQTMEILKEVNETIDRRMKGKEASYPVKVLCMDETLTLCQKSPEVAKVIFRIATESRKCGVFGLFSAQIWKADTIGGSHVRDTLTSRIAHNMKRKQANLLLQDNDLSKVVDGLPTGKALFAPTQGEPEILSIPYCKQEDMIEVVRIVRQANGQEIVIETTHKPVETSEQPKGVIDFDTARAAKAGKKPVNQAEQKEPGETDLVAELNRLCDVRHEGMSKNQWIKAVAEQVGYSDSYIKNILLGNTKLTNESAEKINQYLKTI